MNRNELPLGFSMALSQNPEAMKVFAGLSDDKKQRIIDGTHSVKSKEDMHQYVNNIISDFSKRSNYYVNDRQGSL